MAGSLQVAGLEILGVRAYGPGVRGFISPDPLASPVGLVDPWGLSPMTAGEFREYRQDSSARAWERMGGQLHRWADEHAEAIATAAIIAGTVVSIAALVATGPVGLIVAGAVGGGLLSGGLSILTNKNADGTVDWKKVGLDTLIGGVAGGLGGAAVSVVGKVGSAVNAARAGRFATKAEAAGAKALSLGQKAANSSVVNPMRYVNSVRSSWAGRKAAIWAARSDELGQVAAHYGDLGGYARSLPGQTVQSVTSNVASNNLAYGLGDFQEHTVGGYVRATVSGLGVGVLSPRVTPLRQNYLSGSAVENIAGYGIDRGADYALGVFNYVATPQENSLNITDANKEGLKSMLSGVSGGISSSSADAIRPVTPLP